MVILALDPATKTGFAQGDAGAVPRSGSVRLKRPDEEPGVAAFNVLAFLRDRFVLDKPDLVACEHWLAPVAMKGQDAMILQLMVHGVIAAVCRAYSVRLETVPVQTWRRHYIGKAHGGERGESKRMVLARAKALRHLPPECFDDNQADAVGIFDWASAHFARRTPASLFMFGEAARG